MLVTLTILGIVGVVFMGVSKVSFGKDAQTNQTLGDVLVSNGIQAKLQTDLGGATRMGLTNPPCTPNQGTTVLWTRADPAPTDAGPAASVVAVYYTVPASSSTLLLRAQCLLAENAPVTPAPEGEKVAQWAGDAAMTISCNARPPGDGCGGNTALASPLAADLDAIEAFPGVPTTAPTPAPNGYPAIDPVRIGTELMTITGGWGTGTLNVDRPNRAEHQPTETVRYAPVLVGVCIPWNGAGCTDPTSTALRFLIARKLP
jgi:hypothetical protein